jgi:hypothetical protein
MPVNKPHRDDSGPSDLEAQAAGSWQIYAHPLDLILLGLSLKEYLKAC